MNGSVSTLESIAVLLEYPGSGFQARLAAAPSLPGLAAFRAALDAMPAAEREELYTNTFDVSPVCVPYVSIHLFGEENFKRGEFMAALQERYAQTGFQTRGELPDHLSVLLRFAAGADEAERRELVQFCLLGPVGKMIQSLGREHPYRSLLEAVLESLQALYPGLEPALSPIEQMRQHGAPACPTLSAGCGCGPGNILDGPGDGDAAGEGVEPKRLSTL